MGLLHRELLHGSNYCSFKNGPPLSKYQIPVNCRLKKKLCLCTLTMLSFSLMELAREIEQKELARRIEVCRKTLGSAYDKRWDCDKAFAFHVREVFDSSIPGPCVLDLTPDNVWSFHQGRMELLERDFHAVLPTHAAEAVLSLCREYLIEEAWQAMIICGRMHNAASDLKAKCNRVLVCW